MDTDKNYYSVSDVSDVTVKNHRFDPSEFGVNPAEIDDIVKFSHATNIVFNDIIVDGQGQQKENCIDMNRECKNISIIGALLYQGNQNAITIKGGCDTILLKNITIIPRGGNCDIEIGNHSQQSFKKTTNVILDNVKRFDGKPVRLRVGHADYPTIINSDVEYQWFQSLIAKIYVIGSQLIQRKPK